MGLGLLYISSLTVTNINRSYDVILFYCSDDAYPTVEFSWCQKCGEFSRRDDFLRFKPSSYWKGILFSNISSTFQHVKIYSLRTSMAYLRLDRPVKHWFFTMKKIVVRCANQQLIWGVPVRYLNSMKTQHLYFPYLSNMDSPIKLLLSSDNCTLHILSQDYSLYWFIVNMHCLKALIQKKVIWLPVKFRMSDLYFASRSLKAMTHDATNLMRFVSWN